MKVSVLIDSHGWIEYFADGPLQPKYAKYIESANPSEYITPATIVYEVFKRIKSVKGEDLALKVVAFIAENTTIIPIDKETALEAVEIITGDEHFKGMKNIIFIR